jgi:uncharacterized iron-regulated protein
MPRLALASLLALAIGAAAGADDATLNLAIGDPARRDRMAAVVLDGVTDTATNEVITPAELTRRLAGVRLLLLGESHTAAEFHRVQARVIELLRRAGRRVLIGLEMYPYTEQRWLDAWGSGMTTERDFVDLSGWYEHWGYHWEYYRDIFVYAREHRLPMVAINTPRAVVSAVRKKGFANLTPEEAAHVPASVDVDSPDHMALFKASFDEGDSLHAGMTADAWQGMLSAQATWDATMGFNAVQALQRPENRQAIMAVLVGSGHVSYGLGIERQAKRWFDGPIATLIPVAIGPAGPPKVRASYANFLWGVPEERSPRYPALDVSTRQAEGRPHREIIYVASGSIAERAGLKVGDVILSIDGFPITTQEALKRLVAGKHWGDTALVDIERAGAPTTLTVAFRR